MTTPKLWEDMLYVGVQRVELGVILKDVHTEGGGGVRELADFADEQY